VENPVNEATHAAKALFSRCLVFVCSGCSPKVSRGRARFPCGHDTPCPVAPVSTDASTLEEPSITLLSRQGLSLAGTLPTKVSVLLGDLQKQPGDVKW
jgi:hypothetical protein